MGKWDEYQDFSTNAKPYGGANAYLDFLNSSAKEEGKGEGRIEGIIVGTIATLVVSGVVLASVKVKEYIKKRKQKKQLVADVRQEFLSNVEQSKGHENAEPSASSITYNKDGKPFEGDEVV